MLRHIPLSSGDNSKFRYILTGTVFPAAYLSFDVIKTKSRIIGNSKIG